MCSFGLQNSCHLVWPSVIEHRVLRLGFLVVSCLALVSGQQYNRGDQHIVLDEIGVAGVHSSWSCEAVDMGLAFDRQTSKLLSRAVVLHSLPDLGLSCTLATLFLVSRRVCCFLFSP